MRNAAYFFEGRHGPNENRLQEWKYEARAKILNLLEGKKKLITLILWLQACGGFCWERLERSVCVLYRTHLSHQENETSGPNWMYSNMGKLVPDIPSGCDSERTADSRSNLMTELGLWVPSLLLIEDDPSFLSGKNSQGTSHAPSGFSSGDFCLASNVTTNLRSCVRLGWRGYGWGQVKNLDKQGRESPCFKKRKRAELPLPLNSFSFPFYCLGLDI